MTSRNRCRALRNHAPRPVRPRHDQRQWQPASEVAERRFMGCAHLMRRPVRARTQERRSRQQRSFSNVPRIALHRSSLQRLPPRRCQCHCQCQFIGQQVADKQWGKYARARARARTARPRFYIAVLRGFPFDRFTTRGHVSKVPTSISDREVQRRGQDETRGFSHSEILCVVLAGNARKAVSHTSQQQWRNAGGRSRSEAKTQLPGWIYI